MQAKTLSQEKILGKTGEAGIEVVYKAGDLRRIVAGKLLRQKLLQDRIQQAMRTGDFDQSPILVIGNCR